jgi:hypothetical protein
MLQTMFEAVVKLMCKGQTSRNGNDYTVVETKQTEMGKDNQAV